MFLEVNKVIHPNAIKHSAELLGEQLLPPSVIKQLTEVNFKGQGNGIKCLESFLSGKVNDSIIRELILKVNNYIYSLDCVERIISDYADTSRVRTAMKKKLNRENNNKNYTYDFEAILNDFKSKVMTHYSAYDFNSNGLFKSLIYSFNNFYCKSYYKFIYSVFNEKGSLVNTEEGSVLLESLASIEADDLTKHSIDFATEVKNIYEASKDLFNISGEIHYDLFSYHLANELQKLEETLMDLVRNSFNNESFGPRIVSNSRSFGNVPYRVKTLKKRIELLDLFRINHDNGMDISALQSLFERVVKSDSLITDANIGKLFEHKEVASSANSTNKIKKTKYKKFLDILQGVVSLDNLVTYLHNTGLRLYEDDCIIFRDSAYYKRFNSIEDYLLIKDVTNALIDESKSLDGNGNYVSDFDGIPFMTNDECFDYLLGGTSCNFASLRDYVNNGLKQEMNKFDFASIKTNLVDMFNIFYDCFTQFDQAFNYMSSTLGSVDLAPSGDDQASVTMRKQIFDGVVSAIPNGNQVVEQMLFMFTPKLKEQALLQSDITLLLRYLNFYVNVLYHYIMILDKSNSPLEYSLLTLDRDTMYIPNTVQNLEDVSKFKTYVPMKFYLTGNRNANDVSLRKQYYLFYDDLKRGLGNVFSYLQDWKKSIETKALELDVTFSKEVLSKRLKELSILINGKEDNSTDSLKLFISNYQIVGGFLYINGAIYKHKKGYIHERGYFVDPRLDYIITPIPKDYNLNIVER